MNLMRFDPFREMEDVSRQLNRFFNYPTRRVGEDDGVTMADWAPAMDVHETETEFLVKADLPEVKREDVAVEIDDGMLTVRGDRHQDKEEKGKKFHRIERAYGHFERRLSLPADVDTSKFAAEFKDGVLRVHMPKSATAKPTKVDVKVF